MAKSTWSVQDAKNRFSAMIEAARRSPQTVTKHGKAAVVVVDAEEYERLKKLEQLVAPAFNDHLLSIPVEENGPGEGLTADLRDPDL